KANTLRSLRSRGFRVIVLPHSATWADVEAVEADGLLLANGPGDPAVLEGPVELCRQALGRIPVFGICLGHQILGRAAGATTSRPLIRSVSGAVLPAPPRKVLIVGSGPIVIGQAAEFDYAGSQACKSLREEGVETVLVNSNPATIMTDEEVADRVYIEPLTVEAVTAIIERERPDAVLPTLGGQTGLNLAVELAEAGILEKFGVRLLG